jgi:hypothetical protein
VQLPRPDSFLPTTLPALWALTEILHPGIYFLTAPANPISHTGVCMLLLLPILLHHLSRRVALSWTVFGVVCRAWLRHLVGFGLLLEPAEVSFAFVT